MAVMLDMSQYKCTYYDMDTTYAMGQAHGWLIFFIYAEAEAASASELFQK